MQDGTRELASGVARFGEAGDGLAREAKVEELNAQRWVLDP